MGGVGGGGTTINPNFGTGTGNIQWDITGDGQPDAGVIITNNGDLGGANDINEAVVSATGGSLFITGDLRDSSTQTGTVFIGKLNENTGSFDTTFNSTGYRVIGISDVGGPSGSINDIGVVKILNDGTNIYVLGNIFNPFGSPFSTDNMFFISKYDQNGNTVNFAGPGNNYVRYTLDINSIQETTITHYV